jgi:hypothetical protein
MSAECAYCGRDLLCSTLWLEAFWYTKRSFQTKRNRRRRTTHQMGRIPLASGSLFKYYCQCDKQCDLSNVRRDSLPPLQLLSLSLGAPEQVRHFKQAESSSASSPRTLPRNATCCHPRGALEDSAHVPVALSDSLVRNSRASRSLPSLKKRLVWHKNSSTPRDPGGDASGLHRPLTNFHGPLVEPAQPPT